MWNWSSSNSLSVCELDIYLILRDSVKLIITSLPAAVWSWSSPDAQPQHEDDCPFIPSQNVKFIITSFPSRTQSWSLPHSQSVKLFFTTFPVRVWSLLSLESQPKHEAGLHLIPMQSMIFMTFPVKAASWCSPPASQSVKLIFTSFAVCEAVCSFIPSQNLKQMFNEFPVRLWSLSLPHSEPEHKADHHLIPNQNVKLIFTSFPANVKLIYTSFPARTQS